MSKPQFSSDPSAVDQIIRHLHGRLDMRKWSRAGSCGCLPSAASSRGCCLVSYYIAIGRVRELGYYCAPKSIPSFAACRTKPW